MLSIAFAGRVSTYDRDIFNWMPRLLILPDFIYFLRSHLPAVHQPPAAGARTHPGYRLVGICPFPAAATTAYLAPAPHAEAEFIAKVVNQDFKPFFAWSGGTTAYLLFNAVYWYWCPAHHTAV